MCSLHSQLTLPQSLTAAGELAVTHPAPSGPPEKTPKYFVDGPAPGCQAFPVKRAGQTVVFRHPTLAQYYC